MMDSFSFHDVFQMEDLNMWISMPSSLQGCIHLLRNYLLCPATVLDIVYSRADLKYSLRYYKLISVLLAVFPEV